MKIPSRVFITTGGGWGDVVRLYLRDERRYGYFEGIKARWPGIHIKIMMCSHNSASEELFRFHPCVDECQAFVYQLDGTPYFERYKGKHQDMTRLPQLFNGIPWRKPEIYLSPEEEIQYNEILAGDPFVCINPFAGTADRLAMPIEEYTRLADRIIDELGYRVILIGGTHNRQGLANDGGRQIGSDPKYIPIVEECDYERDRLINLVGKANIRFATKLSAAGYAFVGNFSGPLIAPWCKEIKTVTILAPHEHIENTSRTCTVSCWPIVHNLPFSKAIYMRDNTCDSAIDQTIDFLKQ